MKILTWLPDAAAGIGILAAGIGLVVRSGEVTAAAKEAAKLCFDLIIPSLFPFFVVSSLILNLGYAERAGKLLEPVMRKLFNVSGSCAAAFLLGMVGGYPVGARTAVSLYKSGACSKAEAERLLAFCNNSGPAFILGAVGAGMLGSRKAGILLYAVHILSSVIIGIAFRNCGKSEAEAVPEKCAEPDTAREQPGLMKAFIDAVLSAGTGTLRISAFVIAFAVLTELVFSTGALTFAANLIARFGTEFGIGAAQAEAILRGMMEVTAGLWSLSEVSANLTGKLALSACLLGWSGLCVHCQVLSFLQGSGLAVRPYLIGKLTQGVLSGILIAAFTRLFPDTLEAVSILTQSIAAQAGTTAVGTLLASCRGALAILWGTAVTGLVSGARDCRLHQKA